MRGIKMKDIQILKRFYGEKFAHLCRSTFPLILENETLLPKLIMDSFAPSKALYDDITEDNRDYIRFKDFIFEKYHQYVENQETPKELDNVTAEELMARAGYTLYPECQNFKDLVQFKKYYAPKETLCSFEPRNERLKTCRVWFAVKNGAENLNRKDFHHPEREDEYGSSVISIQYTKDLFSTLSIKNRYNHAVAYPDSTFHNNLDEIIPGLTHAFCTEYGITTFSSKYPVNLKLSDYEKANDGKYYKTINQLKNNCFICENNFVLVDGDAYHFDPDRYLLLDNGDLIDTKEKKISPAFIDLPDNKKSDAIQKYNSTLRNSPFANSFEEITKIDISKNIYGGKTVYITPKDEENRHGQQVVLETNCSNQLVEVFDPMEISPENYLAFSKKLKCASFPNLKVANSGFLQYCIFLNEFSANKIEAMGNHCISSALKLKEINLPNLKTMGSGCFQDARIETFYAPTLEKIGEYCLCNKIKTFTANSLKVVGKASMTGKIETLEVNSLETLPKLGPNIKHLSAKNAINFERKREGGWPFNSDTLASANVFDPDLQDFFDRMIVRNQKEKFRRIEEKTQQEQSR